MPIWRLHTSQVATANTDVLTNFQSRVLGARSLPRSHRGSQRSSRAGPVAASQTDTFATNGALVSKKWGASRRRSSIRALGLGRAGGDLPGRPKFHRISLHMHANQSRCRPLNELQKRRWDLVDIGTHEDEIVLRQTRDSMWDLPFSWTQ